MDGMRKKAAPGPFSGRGTAERGRFSGESGREDYREPEFRDEPSEIAYKYRLCSNSSYATQISLNS